MLGSASALGAVGFIPLAVDAFAFLLSAAKCVVPMLSLELAHAGGGDLPPIGVENVSSWN